MSLGKVWALVVGLFLLGGLAAPAAAQLSPWSFYSSPMGMGGMGGMGGLSGIYGPFGPFGMMGMGGPGSYGYPGYSSYGYSPYGYNAPSGSLFNNDIFADNNAFTDLGQVSDSPLSSSPFSDMFGGSLFKAKQYGPPPTDNIKSALVGQRLTYNSGYMGLPLQYQVEDGDIGDIAGTQYQGADAWKVRVGQQGTYWDVIMDEAGDNILSVSQAQ